MYYPEVPLRVLVESCWVQASHRAQIGREIFAKTELYLKWLCVCVCVVCVVLCVRACVLCVWCVWGKSVCVRQTQIQTDTLNRKRKQSLPTSEQHHDWSGDLERVYEDITRKCGKCVEWRWKSPTLLYWGLRNSNKIQIPKKNRLT